MTDLNKYIALQTALLNEKAKLETRLGEISKVLGQDVSAAAPSPAATTTPGKRTFSDVTKARMAAAQQAGWAAKKSGATEKAVAVGTAKQPKRKLSEATKSKMRAAHQARWAKLRAKSGAAPASVAAPKKTKRVISPEAKARMIAGAKKRWAKVNALKANAAR